MSFIIKKSGGGQVKRPNRNIWGSLDPNKRLKQTVLYTQEEAIPLVQKEINALMNQRIKVRDPTDLLKIQARVKSDLEGLHHAN